MTAILLEAGLSPDTFVPSGLGGPPTRLSAMEFAVLNSPDTQVFKLLWDHGVTPNLSGQIRKEGFWSLGDLVYKRAQTTEKFHDVMAMFSVHARPGAKYSDCISDYSDRIFKDGSQSFCLMAYGLSVRHKKEDFWAEFARRYVGRVPQPLEDEDENLRYPLAAEEAMNREGVIYDSQSRS